MQKLPLDAGEIAVTTFEPTPSKVTAARLGGDTTDEICYCMSELAEDCFGPTAGCSIDHTEA